MADKTFSYGLMLLSLVGALLLMSGSLAELFFVAVMAVLAVLSFLFFAETKKLYTMLLIFFLVGLAFSIFIFLDGTRSLMLWVVTLINLIGFALIVSAPPRAVRKIKPVSKKAAVQKQLGPAQKKPKVTVVKKRRKAKRRKKKK
ncbi:hypothetical protein JXB11_03145 [Candidatus Woesearchaeota archaeon]|nr:hypothetical protein [Candidatus Woesearchaeota archaeon]